MVGVNLQYTANSDMVLEISRLENYYYASYSPVDRLNLYSGIPIVYASREKFDNNLNIVKRTATGIGDLFSQVSYETFFGDDWKIIYNLDILLATGRNPYDNDVGLGNGHNTVGIGQNYIKIIDPVALFAYIGYQYSFAETYSIGKIKPGDDFRFKLGTSISLNPKVRSSFYVSGDIILDTKVDNKKVIASFANLIRFGWGLNWDRSAEWKINMNGIFGMTKNTPDAVIVMGVTRVI